MTRTILGISAYYHDSAAALVNTGELVAAAQEERFTRRKHDAGFPAQAVRYCLEEAGRRLQDIDFIVFYDKPLVKFDRLLETYLSFAPQGFRSFVSSMPIWLKDKLFLKSTLKQELARVGQIKEKELPPLLFTEHHQSHAASAFSPVRLRSRRCCVWTGWGSGPPARSGWGPQYPDAAMGARLPAFTGLAVFGVYLLFCRL